MKSNNTPVLFVTTGGYFSYFCWLQKNMQFIYNCVLDRKI